MNTIKLLATLLTLTASPHIIASKAGHNQYFQALTQIQKIPADAKAITPANNKTITQVLRQLKKQKIKINYQLVHGILQDRSGQAVKLYLGHFSNQAVPEALFLYTNSGSINASGVLQVFEMQKNAVKELKLNPVIRKHLLHGKDLSAFYFNVAKPFAYTLNGKTIIRYMQYPPTNDFDARKIRVCSYLWTQHTIKPVAGKDCIQ
jgi:hypothetical protein